MQLTVQSWYCCQRHPCFLHHPFFKICQEADAGHHCVCAAGGSNIERGLCSAGAIPTLLSLIRRCLEHPQQVSSKKPSRPPRGAAAQSPLLEPGVAALSNLAVESAAVKDDMREAGAISTCVQLLQSDVRMILSYPQTHLPDSRSLLAQSCSRMGCFIAPLIDATAVPISAWTSLAPCCRGQ